MMINRDYTDIVTQARVSGASYATFEKTDYQVNSIQGAKDTLTLSAAAMAKLNGEEVKEVAPIYVKPETARSLLEESKSIDTERDKAQEKDLRFSDMLQNILDKRLGVDRETLKEIEAMMEEIGANDNLSAEEKQKMLEELQKIKEQLMAEGRMNQEQPE